MAPIVSDSYKEKRRKEILDSALACFAKKGFQVATVDDIVEHSGISKGAIYNYFKSKDEIYLELMKASTDNSFEHIKENLAALESPLEKINYLFDLYLSNESDEETLGKLIVHDEFKLHASRHQVLLEKLMKRRHEYFLKILTDILKEGQELGEFKRGLEPDLYADIFWSMVGGTTIQTIYPDYPYRQVLTEMKQMYLEKIKA